MKLEQLCLDISNNKQLQSQEILDILSAVSKQGKLDHLEIYMEKLCLSDENINFLRQIIANDLKLTSLGLSFARGTSLSDNVINAFLIALSGLQSSLILSSILPTFLNWKIKILNC